MADQHDKQQAGSVPRIATGRSPSPSKNLEVQPQDSAQTLVYEPVLNAMYPQVNTPSQAKKLVVFPNDDCQNRASDHTVSVPGAPGPSSHVCMTPHPETKAEPTPGTANSVRQKGRSPPAPPAAKLRF
ncbi:hypothetical protein ABBQ32_012417 [Trebouxia sp. C0010 RCD-2024]